MKKSMGVLLVMIFALLMGTTGAFASGSTPSDDILRALEEVEKTNAQIYHEIDKAVQKSERLFEKYQKDLAKEHDEKKIDRLTAKYEEQVTDLIAKLDKKTQRMTQKGIEKAEKAGLVVEIEWIPVQFADRVAMIDPIRVVEW